MCFATPPSQNAKWHVVLRFFRISCPEVFCKKGALKFLRKCLYWSLFLMTLQVLKPADLLKRDPNTGVFL